MATVSGQNKNKVQVSNNQARYYSEEAQKYAQQAGSYATSAGTSATLCANWAGSVQATYTEAVSVITSTTSAGLTTIEGATTAGLGSIGTATTNGVGSVNSAKTEALTTIQGAKTSGTSAISAATTAGLGSITTAGTSATSSVQAVGTSVVSATTSATEAIKTSVVNATTTAVSGLTSAAVGSVNSASTNALNSISSAKTSAVNTINTLKTEATNTINSLKTQAVTTIQTLTTQGTTTINNAKTDALNTINAAKTSAIATISANVATTSANVDKSHIWAEGTDAQVQALGGTHSAKEWCLYNSTVNQNDVRALESGLNQGEVYTSGDSDSIDSRLAEIKQIAHSTFDISKFTVVGSPNITKDGVASGFSYTPSNYIHCFNYNSLLNRSWHLETNFVKRTDVNNCLLQGFAYWVTQGGLQCWNGSIVDFSAIIGADDDKTAEGTKCSVNISSYVDGTRLYVYLDYNHIDGVYTLGVSDNKLDWITASYAPETTNKQITSIINSTSSSMFLIGRLSNSQQSSSIDLKQFSITVDGVEVFSGNRTGIDTIKPDNYTVIGTPTISADGVASGFSADDYLTITNYLKNMTDYELGIKFTVGSITTNNYLFADGDATTYGFAMYVSNQGKLFIRVGSNSTANNLGVMNLGDEIELNIKVNNSTGTINWLRNGVTQTTVSMDMTGYSVFTGDILYIGKRSSGNQWRGSIDLNAFRLYVDGNLVYQPCLKIPYTESKTGSKIVNSIYRDRVNDMANQFGYANYYTLSDTDFTLPQVELYGLIGQRTLRDSYRNGINYWELYSNRDLEQGGSCTSGVEVTFARPFADTNYVLSVPYSAKSATAFTPTQTGDWIAKGKGIL